MPWWCVIRPLQRQRGRFLQVHEGLREQTRYKTDGCHVGLLRCSCLEVRRDQMGCQGWMSHWLKRRSLGSRKLCRHPPSTLITTIQASLGALKFTDNLFFNTLTTILVETTECITYPMLTSAAFEEVCCRFSLYLTQACPPWVNIDITQWDGADSERRNQRSFDAGSLSFSSVVILFHRVAAESVQLSHAWIINSQSSFFRMFLLYVFNQMRQKKHFHQDFTDFFYWFSRCDWKHIRPLLIKWYVVPTEPIFR